MNVSPPGVSLPGVFPDAEPVFNPVLDRMLRLHRADRARWLSAVRGGIRAFPEISPAQQQAVVRGVVITDAVNRLVFRVQTRLPALAAAASRLIPISDPDSVLAHVPTDRPIILALTHFGPIHLALAVLQRRLGKRTIYAFHAGGDTAAATARYLRGLGVTPLVSDEKSLRIVARAMARDPHCVVVIGFDYLGNHGRKTMPFLGSEISVSRGLAYLADVRNAVVVPACVDRRGPRVTVSAAREVDRNLPYAQRQDELTAELFGMLEESVRQRPSDWTEWLNCRENRPALEGNEGAEGAMLVHR